MLERQNRFYTWFSTTCFSPYNNLALLGEGKKIINVFGVHHCMRGRVVKALRSGRSPLWGRGFESRRMQTFCFWGSRIKSQKPRDLQCSEKTADQHHRTSSLYFILGCVVSIDRGTSDYELLTRRIHLFSNKRQVWQWNVLSRFDFDCYMEYIYIYIHICMTAPPNKVDMQLRNVWLHNTPYLSV